MIFQILDANYSYDSQRNPLVQLFGRTTEGKSVTCRVAGFRPYFYVGVDEGKLNEAKKNLTAMGLEAEEVERFEPIGYQTAPKKMLKITTQDPKEVRSLRERVRRGGGRQGSLRDGYSLQEPLSYRSKFGGDGLGRGPHSRLGGGQGRSDWPWARPARTASCKVDFLTSGAARGQCTFTVHELRYRVPARSWRDA